MTAAEFVAFWESVRLVAMATVGAAGQPHIARELGALHMLLQNRAIADRFVEHDIVLRELVAQGCEHKGRIECAGDALVAARGCALFG